MYLQVNNYQVIQKIKTNKVKKEHYLMRQYNTIYTFLINIGQDKSKLQKEISKLLILNATINKTQFYKIFFSLRVLQLYYLV